MDVQVSNVYLCRASLIKAIVTVTIDGYLAINNIKVLDLDGRLRIVMPNEVDRQGQHHDLVHPITKEFRKQLEQAVLTEYQKKTTGGKQNDKHHLCGK